MSSTQLGQTKKSPSRRNAESLSPRERILAAARELFCKDGIRAVSVDAVAAAADTNKMTLYRHFESKDLLVAECLRSLAAEAETSWQEVARTYTDDPEKRLQVWADQLAHAFAHEGERGCPLANAAVELPDKDHPARAVIEECKTAQRNHLVVLCRDAGYAEPESLADGIILLLEGARMTRQSVGPTGPCCRLDDMVRTVIAGHPKKAS